MLFLSIIMLVACSNSEEKQKAKDSLKYEVELVNKLTPSSVDFMTTLTSCELDGSNLIYNYEIDEDYSTIDEMKEKQMATLKKTLEASWKNNPQLEGTKANLKTIGGKVIYNYVGNTSKKIMSITIELDNL